MTENIKIIQKKELALLKEFIRVCNKHNLKYYILGGTLLGAVRHGGFIPWDDDIDVGMPRNDYEKLMNLYESEFETPYKLVSEKNSSDFTKAFMNLQDTTTKIIMKYSNIAHEESIWMDIFPIDGMPKNYLKNKIHKLRYLSSRMLVQLSQFNKIVNQNKENRHFIEKIIISTAKEINYEKLLNYRKMQKKYINVLSKYDMNEYYSGNLTGAYKLKEVVPSEYFGEGVKILFEDIEVNAPTEYLNYLSAIYGSNYMDLPPEDKRIPHNYDILQL